MIRRAAPDDAAPIAAIFNEFLDQGGLSDTDRPATVQGRQEWLTRRSDLHPVYVCEEGGDTVGWTSVGPFAPRPSCEWLGEIGVYVAADFRGRGRGSELVWCGVEAARDAGLAVLFAVVFARNEPSLELFSGAGFEPTARLCEVARLRGRDEDVVWLAKRLRDE